MAKKMYLVDPQTISSLSAPTPAKQPSVPNPTIDNILKLDGDMKSILNGNGETSLYEKVQKYNQVLEKYLRFYEDYKDKRSAGVVNTQPGVSRGFTFGVTPPPQPSNNNPRLTQNLKEELLSALHTDTIQSLPNSQRPKAKRVLSYLKNIPSLKWSEKGEMILDGQLFTNSHIVDLVGGVIKKHIKTKPNGFEEFKLLLKKHNLPEQLVNFKLKKTPPSSTLDKTPKKKNPPTPTPSKRARRTKISRWESY